MSGDFSRKFNTVPTYGEFWESLLWMCVCHNSNICNLPILGDSIQMDKVCGIYAFDVVPFVALGKLGKFVTHPIIPGGVHTGVGDEVSVLLLLPHGWANSSIDVGIRYAIWVSWIKDINQVCWEGHQRGRVVCGESTEGLCMDWVAMYGRSNSFGVHLDQVVLKCHPWS